MATRTQNTKRNIIASSCLMIIQIAFQFIVRTTIVYAMGEEYLGLSSLFTSILNVLSITELGFAASIVYFMYKPLAENDQETVCKLLAFYKRIYRVIGCIIFIVGVLVMPFIKYLIKGDVPSGINVYVLYFLFLINTSISYFLFSYKTGLLTALQRLDLTKIVNTVVILLQYAAQMAAILVFHNYYLYAIVYIIGTASTNIFTAYICKKKFPEYECRGELNKSVKKGIYSKVQGLMICNISAVTYTSFDSIIVSVFIGLQSVAIYNNYILIFSSITSIIVMLRTAMQASIGNSIACESVEKNLKDMELWQFVYSGIASWFCACMVCLYQPFMRVWMGAEMLLPMTDVILIATWFEVSIVQHAFYLYLAGNGLWNEMKWSYVFGTCFNLLMNILLGKLMGITGIILASLLSVFISGAIWQCRILFKVYFQRSAWNYIAMQFMYFGIAAVVTGITYLVCRFISMGGMTELLIKMGICTVVPTGLLLAVYSRFGLFDRAMTLMKTMLRKL